MNRSPVAIGSVQLAQPLMTASGTAGYGAEFGDYFKLANLGAVVTKSIAHFEWPGNKAPRLHPTRGGMLNSVGLQGAGVESFINNDLVALERTKAKVVVSIWGHSVDDYAKVSAVLKDVRDRVAAIEVNLSCPNLGGDHTMFAHDQKLSASVIDACQVAGLPLWAKLSPNTTHIVDIARAVHSAGAQAVTLVNTLIGMAIDTESGLPILGNIKGGLSGSAIHPVAVRCIYDVRANLPELKIIGAGGVTDGQTAVEMMLAGADAVQVGTASFANPKAPMKILRQLNRWADTHGVTSWSQVTSAAHHGGLVSRSKS